MQGMFNASLALLLASERSQDSDELTQKSPASRLYFPPRSLPSTPSHMYFRPPSVIRKSAKSQVADSLQIEGIPFLLARTLSAFGQGTPLSYVC